MWILSQSKCTLIKCNFITTAIYSGVKGAYAISAINGNDHIVLGSYSTEAKAKKVLEWCYEQIVRKDSPNILAMPQEDEI